MWWANGMSGVIVTVSLLLATWKRVATACGASLLRSKPPRGRFFSVPVVASGAGAPGSADAYVFAIAAISCNDWLRGVPDAPKR